MTRDEIMNMEAGREMDALIAEKVMDEYAYVTHLGMKFVDGSVPAYSTDIAAAWQVVEKMLYFKLELDGEWYCELVPKRGPAGHASASNASLAICRAALLATQEGGE